MQRRTILATGIAVAASTVLPRVGIAAEEPVGPIVDRLRARRHELRLPVLRRSVALTRMARLQALQMHRLGFTTHVSPDGHGPRERALQAGYRGHILGEALAETWEGAVETVDLWLTLSQTRSVLLDPVAQDVGVVGLRDGTGLTRWSLVLGA
jgi:uncharacterized protein YkwD